MGLSLITAPSVEPVLLAEAKAHVRQTEDDHDELISLMIIAARKHVEDETQRALCTQTWDYTIDYEWPDRIRLPLPPLQSVTSISYVDTAGASQTLASNQYLVNLSGGSGEGVIEPAYGVTWPSLRRQMSAITIRFVAGYSTVPEPLDMVIKMLLSHWYTNTDAVVTGTIATTIPLAVNSLMFPYKVLNQCRG